jgi:hypothetical protein
MSPWPSVQNRLCPRCRPSTNLETGGRKGSLRKQIFHFAFEALRFFPATLSGACFFARTAFISRDLFSNFSMVRTRESGIPKFSATFSAETMLSRTRNGRRIFKFYTGLVPDVSLNVATGDNWITFIGPQFKILVHLVLYYEETERRSLPRAGSGQTAKFCHCGERFFLVQFGQWPVFGH